MLLTFGPGNRVMTCHIGIFALIVKTIVIDIVTIWLSSNEGGGRVVDAEKSLPPKIQKKIELTISVFHKRNYKLKITLLKKINKTRKKNMLLGTKKNLVLAVTMAMAGHASSKESSVSRIFESSVIIHAKPFLLTPTSIQIRGYKHRELPGLLSDPSSILSVDQTLDANAGLGDTNSLQKLDLGLDETLGVDASVAGIEAEADLKICIRLESGSYDLKVISLTDVQGIADAQTLLDSGDAQLAGSGLLDINCEGAETPSNDTQDSGVWVCAKSSDSNPTHELLQKATLSEAQAMVDSNEAVLALTNEVGGFYCTPRTVMETPLDLDFEGFGYGDRGDEEGVMVCMPVFSKDEYERLHAFSPIDAQGMIEQGEAIPAQTKTSGAMGHYCVPHTIVDDPIDLHYEAFGEATREPTDGPNRGTQLNLEDDGEESSNPEGDATDFGNDGEATRNPLGDANDFGNDGEATRNPIDGSDFGNDGEATRNPVEDATNDFGNNGEATRNPVEDAASDFGNNGEATRNPVEDANDLFGNDGEATRNPSEGVTDMSGNDGEATRDPLETDSVADSPLDLGGTDGEVARDPIGTDSATDNPLDFGGANGEVTRNPIGTDSIIEVTKAPLVDDLPSRGTSFTGGTISYIEITMKFAALLYFPNLTLCLTLFFLSVRGDPHFAMWDGTKFDVSCTELVIDFSNRILLPRPIANRIVLLFTSSFTENATLC